jgi:hypothetical protein
MCVWLDPLLPNRTQNEAHGAKATKSMGILPLSIYTFEFVAFPMESEMIQQKNQKTEQSNIKNHSEKQFSEIVQQGLKSGGIHTVANKSHGKSRLMFSMAQNLRNLDTCRVIAFDGSETWIYAFSKMPTFTIGEHDILAQKLRTIEEMEKFTLQNGNLVKLALETHKDILFRLKTRKPSKRGYFVRTVVNYLDALQRTEKAQNPNHEPQKHIAYFIEEAQDCFNSRSSARLEMEEFLTVFNEARNNKEAFITASQRLTDFSKTIRSKQLYCIGKLNAEDITPFLRRLEKAHNLEFANMKPRTWFFEGSTFISPQWTQDGKPFQINSEIKQKWLDSLPKKKTLREKIKDYLKAKQQTQRPERKLEPETEQSENSEKIYHCPSCGQECTQEEHESGFCLDCDQIEMFGD